MTASPAPGMPSEEEALSAYNAVWQGAPGIDAHNVEIVRREAMAAVFALIRPAFEAKEREIERHKKTRKRLDHRIHCQRKSNRDNWEIVESRRKWLGSLTAQRAYIHMRTRALSAEAKLAQAVEALRPFAKMAAAYD